MAAKQSAFDGATSATKMEHDANNSKLVALDKQLHVQAECLKTKSEELAASQLELKTTKEANKQTKNQVSLQEETMSKLQKELAGAKVSKHNIDLAVNSFWIL